MAESIEQRKVRLPQVSLPNARIHPMGRWGSSDSNLGFSWQYPVPDTSDLPTRRFANDGRAGSVHSTASPPTSSRLSHNNSIGTMQSKSTTEAGWRDCMVLRLCGWHRIAHRHCGDNPGNCPYQIPVTNQFARSSILVIRSFVVRLIPFNYLPYILQSIQPPPSAYPRLVIPCPGHSPDLKASRRWRCRALAGTWTSYSFPFISNR